MGEVSLGKELRRKHDKSSLGFKELVGLLVSVGLMDQKLKKILLKVFRQLFQTELIS